MGGFRALNGVIPAAVVCGVSFASMQFLVSNYVGPHLVDIVAAIAAIVGLVVLFKVWQPSDEFHLEGESTAVLEIKKHGAGPTVLAWSPYLFLVAFVLVWGSGWGAAILGQVTIAFEWPGLHNIVQRMAPVVENPSPYAAVFTFNWLSAAGTACALATIASAILLRVSAVAYIKLLGSVAKQLSFSLLTIASVLGLAFLMNYSGATVTLGLAFAATGALFPFFSALLGWLGVFLTGSDTSANALFGNLQVVTATRLGLDPAIMASANLPAAQAAAARCWLRAAYSSQASRGIW
jgi:lactate permease